MSLGAVVSLLVLCCFIWFALDCLLVVDGCVYDLLVCLLSCFDVWVISFAYWLGVILFAVGVSVFAYIDVCCLLIGLIDWLDLAVWFCWLMMFCSWFMYSCCGLLVNLFGLGFVGLLVCRCLLYTGVASSLLLCVSVCCRLFALYVFCVWGLASCLWCGWFG